MSPAHMRAESQMEEELDGKPLLTLSPLTAIKYIVALLIVFIGARITHDTRYLVAGVLDIAAVAVISNWLVARNRMLGNLINGVLMLAINLQGTVLVFAASHVTVIMLTNIFNISDLAGKAVLYSVGAVAAIVVSFLPIRPFGRLVPERLVFVLPVAVALEAASCLGVGVTYAPLGAWVDVANQWGRYASMTEQMDAIEREDDWTIDSEELGAYYRDGVSGGCDKPACLPDQPNVIIIFTEGLSQHIIDDERGIMPNVAHYQQESLRFTNYYNHTAATFRALNGQLYSGFQLDDLDANALVSLQSIMSDQGYHTSFINPEADHEKWCDFLTYLGFDQIVSESATGTYSIPNREMSMADGEAYQTLMDVVAREAENDQPFLVTMYTFGTHVSLDSPEESFGDGSDALLNRFYNCDYQFGQFMEWFEQSELVDNTVVVFTADHATYSDLEFATSFPGYERVHYFCDTMPLFIYYKGVVPEQIDAEGRTTLDFTPTLLDLLDISAPNCFLGTSLYLERSSDLEAVYFDGVLLSTSRDGVIGFPEGEEEEALRDQVMDYISFSRIPLE